MLIDGYYMSASIFHILEIQILFQEEFPMDSQYYDVANRILKNDAEREAVLLALTRQIGKAAIAVPELDVQGEIANAKEFWKRVREFPERALKTLKAVRQRTTGVTVYSSETPQLKYDLFVLRMAYLRRFENHSNRFVRIVANLESLRTPVVRRFFWYANVDFQGIDSFFLRLTGDQEESLTEHARISYRYLACKETVEFPCFGEGFANFVANRFQSASEAEAERIGVENDAARYASKSAVAYDLFGWDFGFKLYSDENSEHKNPTSLPGQTLLSLRGEDFSVNTESRGIYWWLYRTIRSNPLWGKEDVTLRTHVCPGFWATVFLWAFLVVGSPVAFVAGIAGIEEIYGKALLVPGMVTPAILLAIGYSLFMKKFGDGYDKKFAGASIVAAVFVVVVAVVGYHLAELAKWLDWSEPVNLLIAAFLPIWAGYAFSKEKAVAPWQLPILGPAFLAAIAVRATWLGYFEHPELFFTIVSNVLGLIGIVIGAAAVVYVGSKAWELLKWANRRLESVFESSKSKAIEFAKAGDAENSQRVIKSERVFAEVSTIFGTLAILFLCYLNYSLFASGTGEALVIPIAAMSLYVMSLFGIIAWCGMNGLYDSKPEVFGQYVVGSIIGFYSAPEFQKALARNPAFRRKDGTFDGELLKRFVESANFRKAWNNLDDDIIITMAANAKAESVERFANAKTKTYLLPYVAMGMRYGEARKTFKHDLAMKEKIRMECLKAAEKRREARKKAKQTATDILLSLPKAVMSGIATLGLLKKTFDNHCPHIYRSKQVG